MASSLKGIYKKESTAAVMSKVHRALKLAGTYQMQIEVVATAMIFLKENPDAFIYDALKAGLTDWDLEWDRF